MGRRFYLGNKRLIWDKNNTFPDEDRSKNNSRQTQHNKKVKMCGLRGKTLPSREFLVFVGVAKSLNKRERKARSRCVTLEIR